MNKADSRWEYLQQCFHRALDSGSEERRSFLVRLRKEDSTLAREVEELLDGCLHSGQFLEKPLVPNVSTLLESVRSLGSGPAPDSQDTPPPPKQDQEPGSFRASEAQEEASEPEEAGLHPGWVGAYRILGKLGEGGMGVVYKAELDQPARRVVALKLIRERHSPEVAARFATEFQALALMSHSNIAHVYQSGIASDGRPFFTMEYIEGEPITEFCDRHCLSVSQRLRLFITVCEGVLHAHQKGFIHRDLKPSNILVTMQDQRPIPKIIDFGIAKGFDTGSADRSVETEWGALIGTPAYMSPEQARSGLEEVDTRSDIYSLGAILYELLTGFPIFAIEEYRKLALDEKIRLISEREPLRPVVRIHHGGKEIHSVASHRGMSPDSLSKCLRGDLEWIVLKALQKPLSHRYASISEFKNDIDAFLNHRVVSATPPTLEDRLKKFFRRHKVAILATTLTLSALLTGLIIATAGWLQASRARLQAEASQMETRRALDRVAANNRFMRNMLTAPHPDREGRRVTVVEVLERAEAGLNRNFSGQEDLEITARFLLGSSFYALGVYPKAEHHLRRAQLLAQQFRHPSHEETVNIMDLLARILKRRGAYEEAEDLFRLTMEQQASLWQEDHPQRLLTASGLAAVLQARGKHQEAESLFRDTLAVQLDLLGENHRDTAQTMVGLAGTLRVRDQYIEAESLYRNALAAQRSLLEPDHTQILATMNNLANCLLEQGKHTDAEALFSETLSRRLRVLGPNHPHTSSSKHGLARALFHLGRFLDAEPLSAEVYHQREKILSPNHPDTLASMNNHAIILGKLGRPEEAIPLLRRIIGIYRELGQEEQLGALRAMNNLGVYLSERGDHSEAITLLERTATIKLRIFGEGRITTLNSLCTLGECYQSAGRCREAEQQFRKTRDLAERYLPQGSPRTALFRIYLANSLTRSACFHEAEFHLLETLEDPAPNPHLTFLLAGLVELYAAWGNRTKQAYFRALHQQL